MVVLYVNHHGWLMGGSIENGFKFSSIRDSAKPFPLRMPGNQTEIIIDYIRNKMGCNVDVIKYNPV